MSKIPLKLLLGSVGLFITVFTAEQVWALNTGAFMKFIAPALLVAYAVYSAFVPTSIPHSIILFSLAALFGWTQYLSQQQENNKYTETLASEVAKFRAELEKQKELYDKKLSEIEGEVTKMSLNVVKATSSPSKPQQERRTYTF